jgi:hypothetical protein
MTDADKNAIETHTPTRIQIGTALTRGGELDSVIGFILRHRTPPRPEALVGVR